MALTKKAEKTKLKLLESAKKLISERGFEQVSVEDITKESGVAKGTFYHYFKTKEDVIGELSFRSSQMIFEQSIALKGGVVARCIYFLMGIYKDAEWAGVRLTRQWIRESLETEEGSSSIRKELNNLKNEFIRLLEVHQGKGSGELTEDAPVDTLAKLMMSHFFGVLTIWCIMNGTWRITDKENHKYLHVDMENLLSPYIMK